ncbi:MAG: amidohydrolase family protein [bacterium]
MKDRPPEKSIDCHCHIGASGADSAGISYDEIKAMLDEFPMEHVVVFPVDEADKGPTYERVNDRLAEVAGKDPRLIPFGRVNPHAGDAALTEMDRFESLGFRGLKLHPYSEKFGPESAGEIFKKAGEMGLPIMLHSMHRSFFEDRDGWLRNFELTGSPVIVAHSGKDSYREFAGAVKGLPHVCADTTAVSYNRTKVMLGILGPDRLVYGSDMPYSHPAIEITKYNLILAPEDREKVFYRNAKRILGL